MMDISTQHQNSKFDEYWEDLVSGKTGQYKENAIDALLESNIQKSCRKLLEIGGGTCDLIFKYYEKLNSESITFVDYDSKIIDAMKKKYHKEHISWFVEDIFKLKDWNEKFDLVFLLDMLHEIYSFYGRPNRERHRPVDHALGSQFVKEAIFNVASRVNRKGGIIITDNLVCHEDFPIKVRVKTKQVQEAIKYFSEHYTTKNFNIEIDDQDDFCINARDFCILLTQYNKIKRGDWERFNIERWEIHQYMTKKEYEELFSSLGFQTHIMIGTPKETSQEWREDFQIIRGLDYFPEKRITLLAIRD